MAFCVSGSHRRFLSRPTCLPLQIQFRTLRRGVLSLSRREIPAVRRHGPNFRMVSTTAERAAITTTGRPHAFSSLSYRGEEVSAVSVPRGNFRNKLDHMSQWSNFHFRRAGGTPVPDSTFSSFRFWRLMKFRQACIYKQPLRSCFWVTGGTRTPQHILQVFIFERPMKFQQSSVAWW